MAAEEIRGGVTRTVAAIEVECDRIASELLRLDAEHRVDDRRFEAAVERGSQGEVMRLERDMNRIASAIRSLERRALELDAEHRIVELFESGRR